MRPSAALFAGLGCYAAFPPRDFWPLLLLGLMLLLHLLRTARPPEAALLGFLAGLGFFLPLLNWAGTLAGTLAWITLAALQASFVAGFAACFSLHRQRPWWPGWAAVCWVGFEALRAQIPFGGFPWGRLAFGALDSPFASLAALGSTPLVALVIVLTAAFPLWCWPRRRETRTLIPLALLTLLLTSPLLLSLPTPADELRVAAIQGNVPRAGLDLERQRAAVLANHIEASAALAERVERGQAPRPDVVLWPENASDVDLTRDARAAARVQEVVTALQAPTLVGTVVVRPDGRLENTGIVWDPLTGPGRRYVKRHPAPFGEYLPLRPLVERITSKAELIPRDFVAGEGSGVLSMGGTLVGDVICFEVAYDDLVADLVAGGAEILVVQTNNATFGFSEESSQQLAMSRLRAIEHQRSVVVVATSGISALITPDGEILQASELFTRDVLEASLPLHTHATPARLAGPLLSWAALAWLGLALLWRARAQPRRLRPGSSSRSGSGSTPVSSPSATST